MLNKNTIPAILARQFARAKGRNVWGSRYDGDRRYGVWAMCGTIGATDRTYGKIGSHEVCVLEHYARNGNKYVRSGVTVMSCRAHLVEDPNTAVTIQYAHA